jgi:hypothetical protein
MADLKIHFNAKARSRQGRKEGNGNFATGLSPNTEPASNFNRREQR